MYKKQKFYDAQLVFNGLQTTDRSDKNYQS